MEGFEDLSLDVNSDDYAETAAGDIPSTPRTYQSEEQFQAIRAAYTAKHDAGSSYRDLLAQIPVLDGSVADSSDVPKQRLDKKQQLLLGYAAGELYLHKRYAELIQLCNQVEAHVHLDKKLESSVSRWSAKCKDKLG